MAWIYIICALALIALALLFIALGIKVANRYNKIAWDKYYEGMGVRAATGTATGTAAAHRKPA